MEAFNDQSLRPSPHIAVLFYDALGDFVIITPLLRGLREKYPGCTIDYFGGDHTKEFEEASDLIDSRVSVFGAGDRMSELIGYVERRKREAGEYDLAINADFHPALAMAARLINARFVVGNCWTQDLRAEIPKPPGKVHELHTAYWSELDFMERFGDVLDSNFIGEIWCRMCFVQTDFHKCELPQADPECEIPDVLISTGGRRSAKLWSADHWIAFLRLCSTHGLSVGLLGNKPAMQSAVYNTGDAETRLLAETELIDLRGRFALPQVVGALARCRACVTVDNGIMHMSYASGTKTLALFGASNYELWTPRANNLIVLLPDEPCDLCRQNRFKNADCLLPVHQCMNSIRPEAVMERLLQVLAAR